MGTGRVDRLDDDVDARDLRRVSVAVLAKAPLPGLAKTRLIPALGAAGAARLQRALTHDALRQARDAQLGAVTLWCAPDARHRCFRALQAASGITCLDQPAGDLGARMHAAFERQGLEQDQDAPMLLIGTDCPPLTPQHLRDAAAVLLAGDDAVFIPAEDGGYVLVGLRRPQPTLFSEMRWSTASVMAETRLRAQAAGLRWREFETLWDLDRPADLERWRAADPEAMTRSAAAPAAGAAKDGA